MVVEVTVTDTDGMTASTSTAVIRQWARDNGLPVGERGRLSPELTNAYVHSTAAAPEASGAESPAPARAARRRPAGVIHIPVQPTPGATGMARKVAARSS